MKSDKFKIGIPLFCIIVFFVDTYFRAQHAITIRLFTKPLIIVSLFFYYWIRVKKRNYIFELGLLSNLIADFLLLFDLYNDILLALGIFFFGTAHIIYALLVLQRITRSKIYSYSMGILFFGSYALIYFSQLFTKFDQMAILVYLFALVEIFFGTVCFVYFFQKIGWERFMILAAPILFFISSILTGYNTFLYNSHFFTYGIGIAYCLGQFLVVHFFSRKYALP